MDYSKLSTETLKALQEGKPVDYSKLSTEELQELQKISAQPIQPKVEPIEIPQASLTESALRGAAQGASFGFADEATAALEAAAGSLGVVPDKTYEQALAESREAYKTAEDVNPVTYNIGNILGGFAVPAGAVGVAGKGAGLATRAIQGAKAGAAAGALSAAGTQEKDKLSMDTVTDVLSSAAIGGALGGTLTGVLPGAVNKLDEFMEAYKPYEVAKAARQAAKEGKELFGAQAKKKLVREARDVSDEYIDELQKSSKRVGKLYDAVAENAQLKQVKAEPIIDDLLMKKPQPNNPADIRVLSDIDRTLNNVIKRVERKEITGFMPSGSVAKVADRDKIANKLNQMVAAGNKTAYDSLARYVVAREQGLPVGKLQKILEESGIDSAILRDSENNLTSGALELAKSLTDPNDINSLSKLLQDANVLPAPRIISELDPQTGLEVIRSVRGDSTLSLAVPKPVESLITKIKPVFEKRAIVTRPELSQKELSSAINDLKGFIYQKDLNPDLRKYVNESVDALENLRDRATKSKLAKVDKAYRTAGLAKAEIGMPANYGTAFKDEALEKAKARQIAGTVEDLFEGRTQEVVGLQKSLDEAKKISTKVPDIEKRMKEISKDLEVARSLTMESGLGGNKNLGPISSLTQMSARAATSLPFYAAGRAERAITKTIPDKLTKIGKSLYSQTPEQMQPIVNSLVQKGSKYAEPLAKALQQPDRKRKALLFTLMQQPGFREDVQDLLGITEDE